MAKKTLGLALGGGGAAGMAHIGVIECLEANGIRPDLIVGSSIGAVVGGLYALDPSVSSLKSRAESIFRDESVAKMMRSLARRPDVSGNRYARDLSQFIHRQLAGIKVINTISLRPREELETILAQAFDDSRIEQCRIPFAAVALDVVNGEEIAIREGRLLEAVYASAAIPGIFPPQVKGERVLVDGGFTANCPVGFARALGANLVIAVQLNRELATCDSGDTGVDILTRTDEIARHKLAMLETASADLIIAPNSTKLHWSDFSEWRSVVTSGHEAATARSAELRRLRESLRPGLLGKLLKALARS